MLGSSYPHACSNIDCYAGGLSVQSDHSSRYVIESVLNNYVLKDYGERRKLCCLTIPAVGYDGDVPVVC